MPNVAAPQPNDPPWLIAAFHDLGLHETSGQRSNARITEMYRAAGVERPENLDDSTTSWCSAAMNAWFVESGLRGTKSLAGRSWLKRGKKLDDSKKLPRGALLILKYDNDPSHGHICVLLADEGDRLREIGGNQSDGVTVSSWPRDRLIAAVWPDGVPMTNVVPLPKAKPNPLPAPEAEPQMPPDVPAPEPDQPRHPDDPGTKPNPPLADDERVPFVKRWWRRITGYGAGALGGGGFLAWLTDWRVIATIFGGVILVAILVTLLMGPSNVRNFIRRQINKG